MSAGSRDSMLYRCWGCETPFAPSQARGTLLACSKARCRSKAFRLRREGVPVYPRLICAWCEQPMEGERRGRYHVVCYRLRDKLASPPRRALDRLKVMPEIAARTEQIRAGFREMFG